MKKIFAYIIILFASLGTALAQQTTEEKFNQLTVEQMALRKSQDSLLALLSSAREQISTASDDQKAELSSSIVRFEGELFDLRSRISRVGSQIAAIEEQYAANSLIQQESSHTAQSAVLHQNHFFTSNLSNKDINIVASQNKFEAEVANALDAVGPLYDQLVDLKKIYDRSLIQSDVDETRAQAAAIKGKITSIDESIGKQWNILYNYLLDTYLVLLDKAPNKDRSAIEAIEVESREVRRAETFMGNGNLTSQLAAFDLQRKLLLSYQRAIAKAANLTDAYNAMAARRIAPIKTSYSDIEFLPRVLTVYGSAMTNYTYPSDNVADIPEMIIPETGVYYSIQVALMSSPAKSMDMFKKVCPLQWQKSSDGKYRYLVGGFHSHEAAARSVAILTKAGFKYPVLMAWNNGAPISATKAKTIEKPTVDESNASYKIIVLTKNPAAAQTIKNTIEMHAKGHSIIRLAVGDQLQFSINDFPVREEAEVLAQILRERTESSVTVEPTTTKQ